MWSTTILVYNRAMSYVYLLYDIPFTIYDYLIWSLPIWLSRLLVLG